MTTLPLFEPPADAPARLRFALHQGDCLEVLRTLPDASVHAVVTDPPYGLSDHKPAEVTACLQAWLAGKPYVPKARGGFMDKTWDAWVPGPEVWRECLRVLKPGGHLLAFAGTRSMDLMTMAVRLAGFELRDSIGYAHDGGGAPVLAWVRGQGMPKSRNGPWGGTALRPAWEPIILARRPLQGTTRDNWAAYGTGALNIPACLVNGTRWPANVAHDGGAAADILGPAARFFYCPKVSSAERHLGLEHPGHQFKQGTTLRMVEATATRGNNHPTVKPIALMAYLCRLVTPPGGTVLDPFLGSGSTGIAALREGFDFLGIERDPEYLAIAQARIAAA